MFENFKTDKEIKNHLEQEINKIESLDECRLYREEQFSMKEWIFKFRNLIEWIIRANSLIEDIKFSLLESLKYAEFIKTPFDENFEKKRCSYFISNAVYREIILWDVFKNFLSIFYDMENSIKKNESIYKTLKKIKNVELKKMKDYLNSPKHQMIRTDLRNEYSHSTDPMMMTFFHIEVDGFIKPDIRTSAFTHPFEHIQNIIDDLEKLLSFFKLYIEKMNKELYEKYALYDIYLIALCNSEVKDSPYYYENLQEVKENAYIFCSEKKCKHLQKIEDKEVCKAKEVFYNRIYSPEEDKKKL